MLSAQQFKPPLRDGVSPSTVFLPFSIQYQTTFEFLCNKFAHISRQEWLQRFADGLVFSQSGLCLNQQSLYLSEQHIYYYRHLGSETLVPFTYEILFENDEFMLIDKPHFLTVNPTGQYVQQTLLTRLKKDTGNADLTPIHRLDRETAGLILISKNKLTRGIYQQLFAQKKVKKIYHAIASYNAHLSFPMHFSAFMQKGEPFYTMCINDGVANSHTEIDILEHNHFWAKYQLNPITGKQHQLRVHMNALGLALKNDRLYPKIKHDIENFNQPLQLLAKYIYFEDPLTQQQMYFSSKKDIYLPE
ncbi:pseudouridylate synthase [Acinetobacter qingfengensis]|uniref:Pseudouridylate synthase n=1 Tax=Acinetobacter qingfengensis TaxID=1262585 RepID=A0A1E7R2Q0_9GAMM|nr:pseudouridine synthase [Acinetobacter qingfengensis]KAA8735333.1 pseudouridylate synthase [Acinetobacter qingfengensis]OEY93580.1 pseudouridylate synthase [Acinetobacter qingfengensis]